MPDFPLQALLGHPAAIEFVSVIVSWPGADAQEYHRDALVRQLRHHFGPFFSSRISQL